MEWLEQITERSQLFMSGLPDTESPYPDKRMTVVHLITFTNITLGFFSTQGIQEKLLGQKYNKDEIFEEHNRIVYRIFKSLLL